MSVGETRTRAVPALEWVTTVTDVADVAYLASTCEIRVRGAPCRLTNTVARSVARCSRTPNISLNMRPLIRIARNAEARRFSTYQRRLSRKRPKRAEIYLLSIRFLVRMISRGHELLVFGAMNCGLRNSCPSEPARVTSDKSALSSQRHPATRASI